MIKRVLLLDLNYHLNRAAHVPALEQLRDGQGRKTGAVFGLLNTIQVCAMRSEFCSKVIGVWDGGRSRRRLKIYPPDELTQVGYKANRGVLASMTEEEKAKKREMLETLKVARELSTPVLNAAGVHVVTWPEREADDVIALLARELAGKYAEQVIIASDDWDFAQCVSDRVCVYRPMNEKWLHMYNFVEVVGVPVDWAPVKRAVEGDGSDNIPGVNGAGPKTVISAVREFAATKIEGFSEEYFDSHQYRDTKPQDLTEWFDWCQKHRLKKPQYIGLGRSTVMRNLDLMDVLLEEFPADHVQQLVSGVMNARTFDEMGTVRLLGDLNINSLLENFAHWSEPFRRLA